MDNRLWSRETWEVRQGGYSGLWLTQVQDAVPEHPTGHFLAVSPQTGHLTSSSLGVPTCKRC